MYDISEQHSLGLCTNQDQMQIRVHFQPLYPSADGQLMEWSCHKYQFFFFFAFSAKDLENYEVICLKTKPN